MNSVDSSGGESRPGRRWQARLTSFLLGTTSGMGVNLVSTDAGYRGVAVTAALAALLTASSWLRTLPPRAPIVRHSTRLLLAVGLVMAAIAAAGPQRLAPFAVLAAAVSVAGAISIRVGSRQVVRILIGAAFVGAGVGAVGAGAAALVDRDWPLGAAIGGFGVAAVGAGAAFLVDRERLADVAFVCAGVAAVGAGAVALVDRDWLLGSAAVGAGMAAVGYGVAFLVDRERLAYLAAVGLGATAVGYGVATLVDRDWLLGAAAVGIGLAIGSLGVTRFVDSTGHSRFRGWLLSLTREPASQPAVGRIGGTGAERPGRHQSAT